MERSDALIKFVSILVFIAVLVYLGASFISSYRDPLRTVTAAGMELRDGTATQGIIVRDEQVLTLSGENIAVTATEGAKIASGETVAMNYVGSAAMERAQQIGEIQQEIRRLTAIKNGKTSQELASEALLALSRSLASGELTKLYDLEQDVDAYIISGTAVSDGMEAQRIAELEEQLRYLSQSASADTVRLTAPFSGTFSFTVDGHEDISPEDIRDLRPGDLERLLDAGSQPPREALGKLIRGIRWYYVTEMSEAEAVKLRVGGTASLLFSRTYSADLSMRVESVSLAEDGLCTVVFSTDKYMQDIAAIRDVTAQVVFHTLSGVSVPREAVHLNDEGKSVVYVLRGATAHETEITIIAESGDYYMVEETRTGLRVNDTVIVRAGNLYDGAVVEH